MPQETNLNVAPYFDDFDENQNYYKVLFKPGYPVQARELTGLQSILQNQIEEMGNHFFKEGAKVIPGDLTYVKNFYCIQIESDFLGISVGIYLDQIVGTTIIGQTSGVTAKVVKYITDQESERGVYTLYLNYENSASSDEEVNTFVSGEILITNTNISYATTFIAAGEGFATTIPTNASAIGSAFYLNQGIYFLRGYFVDVESQTLILDQYGNTPSYRVGLDVIEEIISSDIDQNLNDNARGFNNFTAPGADRLKISATLSKKESDSFNESNFVQLAEVLNGELRTVNKNTEYSFIGDEFARRTFDESGHYYVKEFTTSVKNSLNDEKGNRGIFTVNQTTSQGNTPSDDLGIYKISPGKAYVKGYEVETLSTTLMDFQKPRTTKVIKNQAVNFGFGPTLEVNNVYGSVTIGINTSNTLSLRSTRVGTDPESPVGKEIGVARIYDFALESGSYDSTFPNLNRWDLSLFDVQTYTDISLNESVSLSTPVHIKGESSGATGFLKNSVVGTSLTAYGVNGNFFKGERLIFNGVVDDSRFVTDSKNFEISDVKSVYGIVGTGSTFSADLIQSPVFTIGNASASVVSGNESEISIPVDPGFSFVGIVSEGNLIRYSRPTFDIVSYGRVTGVGRTNITITGVTTVTGVCDGEVPQTTENISNVQVISTKIQRNVGSGNISDNESLYSIFPKKNISSVNLINSELVIRRQYTTNITNNSTPVITAKTNEVFLPFDEERYTLIRSDGSTEILTQDKVNLTNGSTQLQINGLGTNDTNSKLITTIRKSNISSKSKLKSISNSIIVDKSSNSASGVGTTSLNDGLIYGNYPFGTRVQDDIISLNTPDVIKIYGIFESEDTTNPTSPNMTLGQMDGPTSTTTDLIIGETITGNVSGAKAIFLERTSDTQVSFVYLNNIVFKNNEVVTFDRSNVSAVTSSVSIGSKNIIKNFIFNNGQKGSFYDYSRIIRKASSAIPTKKLKILYETANYATSDEGDITTVNSYSSFNYGDEISTVNGRRNSDIIDVRPRVVDYVVSEGVRSPFEFDGRSFADSVEGNQHSSPHIIASDESMTLGYEYYLPRADRIYVDKNGTFSISYGTPNDQPRLPDSISGAMNIANVFLPAYLYNVSDAKVNFVEHKRYQMTDIAKLEQRIKNLEYYTSLNSLEQNTLNLFVEDSNGLNRFKSGVFVDNFTSLEPQDTQIGVRNSVDTKKGILRPSHYTTSLNLELGTSAITGIGTTSNANQDTEYAEVIGSNVKRNGRCISLDYTNVSWLKQPYATRVENVTPFLVQFWNGSIKLQPDVDVWIDVNVMEVNNVMMEGSFQGISEALGAEISTTEDGTRQGVSPVIWNSWETVGVNMDLSLSNNQQFIQGASDVISNGLVNNLLQGADVGINQIVDASDAIVNNITARGSISLDQQRTGSQSIVNEVIETESLGDRVVSRDIIHFMRSRNIQFTGTRFKPYTRLYSFFDEVDVNKFITPKLIEIQMVHGVFRVGERVVGTMNNGGSEKISSSAEASIRFRVANSNHKYGPYNSPTDVFDENPYDRNNLIPSVYSASSTILNVDTFSLQSEDFPQFEGYIATGMKLVGSSSGAQAAITNVRLISDRVGTIIGSYRVPDSANSANPVFETGRSIFRLTSSRINSGIEGTTTTAGEGNFYSEGSVDNTQETTLSLRNATVETADFSQVRRTGDQFTSNTISIESGFDVITNVQQDITNITNIQQDITNVTNVQQNITNVTNVTNVNNNITNVTNNIRNITQQVDPLAQTFFVDDDTGIFVTKIDIYFQSKDINLPVTVQLREVSLGTPTNRILPFSQVDIDPADIVVSENATVPTTVTFDSPVYLNGRTEYSIVLLSHSTEYRVWISRMGEPDVQTISQESGQILVTEQPLLGSLFKSQNASVWTPSQYEDLKFELYRANFRQTGAFQMFNPDLPSSLEKIDPNGLVIESRKIRVGLGTTVNDIGLSIGNLITQENNPASGTLVAFAGSVTSDLSITNPGVGYTPSVGHFTYTGVALTSITGSGINATADITISNGVALGATINNGGTGHVVGDVLTPISIGSENLGSGIQLSVSTILGNNELVIDDVQGNFNVLNNLFYTTSSGISTELNYSVGGNVIPQNPIYVDNPGTYIKVLQRNHGMYSNVNRVEIEGVKSDVIPAKLTVQYPFDSTSFITLDDAATNFATFENIGVGNTNSGYIKIGNEIISYSGINGRTLSGITRGVDNTIPETHAEGELVYKYQLNGVSLRRINTSHQLANVISSDIDDPIGLDYYYIRILMNTNGTNRAPGNVEGYSPLYFNQSKSAGGPDVKGTYNLPYSLITPKITTITPTGTNIISQVRTISATSISGNQQSFIDEGYQQVTLFDKNYFDSQRMIASKVNESNILDSEIFPGQKSFSMIMNLISSDSRLSPVVDLDNASVVYTMNRVNRPITNYSADFRVNGTENDPNRFFYVSKNVILENPATSLQVILDAYVSNYNDIRVFYSLNQDVKPSETIFIPFPGYSNISSNGSIIDISNNDGSSDLKVPKVDSYQPEPSFNLYKELKFSIDDAVPFRSFRIKIIGTSTDQSNVPLIRNLRGIALA
jgi:hypothetical protein